MLLFVFWYCHKRGREVRLEKERIEGEEEVSGMGEDTEVGNYTTRSSETRDGAPTGMCNTSQSETHRHEGTYPFRENRRDHADEYL